LSLIASQMPRPLTFLRLGRVSNLPTVWTNVIAGATIAASAAPPGKIVVLVFAMTAFYVGGMYLNDYCDRNIDARERPERPICAGEISAAAVFAIGLSLLLLGVLLLLPFGFAAMAWGLALGGAVVLYDAWHKGNAFGPLIMGVCRALVYLGTGAAVADGVSSALIGWSIVLAAHVVGLTYAAKQEGLNQIGHMWPLAVLALPLVAGLAALTHGWPVLFCLALLALLDGYAVRLLAARLKMGDVPRAVSTLIAAISAVDALVVASNGGGAALVLVCAMGYPLTRLCQNIVPGT
jgi:UbiA prenyltransferase family